MNFMTVIQYNINIIDEHGGKISLQLYSKSLTDTPMNSRLPRTLKKSLNILAPVV